MTPHEKELHRMYTYTLCTHELPPTPGKYWCKVANGDVIQLNYYADVYGDSWARVNNGEEYPYDHVIGWWEK